MAQGPMLPYRQGKLDSLCGLYATINALRWATRDDNIEEEFWGEVFDSLVLATDVQVGMAHVLISGIGSKSLLRILRQVFAEVAFRFGRRFEVRRPLRGLSARRPDCIIDQLGWLAEQSHTAVMLIVQGDTSHWTALKEVDGRRLLVLDSTGASDVEPYWEHSFGVDEVPHLIMPKSVIVIERMTDRYI